MTIEFELQLILFHAQGWSSKSNRRERRSRTKHKNGLERKIFYATKDCRTDRHFFVVAWKCLVSGSRQEKRVALFVRGHGLYSCFSFLWKNRFAVIKQKRRLGPHTGNRSNTSQKKESFLQFVRRTNINQRGTSDEPTIWAISHVRLLFCMLCKCFSIFHFFFCLHIQQRIQMMLIYEAILWTLRCRNEFFTLPPPFFLTNPEDCFLSVSAFSTIQFCLYHPIHLSLPSFVFSTVIRRHRADTVAGI